MHPPDVDLRIFLKHYGISYVDVVEKDEMVEKVLKQLQIMTAKELKDSVVR